MEDITKLLAAVIAQTAATNEANELQRERIERLEAQQQTSPTVGNSKCCNNSSSGISSGHWRGFGKTY